MENRTNYFFISSPLHFFIACNLAIVMEKDTNIAVIIARNRNVSNLYGAVAEKLGDIFDSAHVLLADPSKKRAQNMRTAGEKITAFLHNQPADVIFTGNDRRYEFQLAMHRAQKINRNVTGAYMDDGAVSYLGHKSMEKAQHRYFDPILKKLFYGFWWKNSLSTGTSGWIDEAYLAFPQFAHPLLQKKRIHRIDHAVFLSEKFRKIVMLCLEEHPGLFSAISRYKVIVSLPGEPSYLHQPEVLASLNSLLRQNFAVEEIAVKAHPRSTQLNLLQEKFPGLTMIDSQLGMELLLPLLQENCLLIGDVASTLLTAKWLRPDLQSVALQYTQTVSPDLDNLFRQLEIPVRDIKKLNKEDFN